MNKFYFYCMDNFKVPPVNSLLHIVILSIATSGHSLYHTES